jgi:DNA helicase II / ATP-dependent DNA helicase PcrA
MTASTSSHIDYEAELNSRQLEAVTVPAGPVLVIAGAGSGKTRTIVYRVAWLVERGIDPASILLLTFTRKASEEMLSRAAALLDRKIDRVSGGTFHSTGNSLLRRYAHLLGFDSSFSIMDQGDALETLDHVKKNLDPPLADLKAFPKTRTIAEILGRAVGGDGDIEAVVRKRYPHFLIYADDLAKIGEIYEKHKKSNNLMDYDDLLIQTVRLLEENEHVREAISTRWQYILVDEYQDTNRLQSRIVRLAAYTHDNVMVVGDDSQSIYSFRGADFTNIMEFPKAFPGTTVIKLEENYRSTQPILRVTNTIIEASQVGYPKKLFTRKSGGSLPLIARPATERDQSRFVVDCVTELRDHGVLLSKVAVLFRAGFHSFDLEGELNRSGIPFVKYGGFKFLESQHIKDVLAHLKVVNNPADRISWIRILKLLPGVGVKTATSLAGSIAAEGIPTHAAKYVPKGRKYHEHFAGLVELLKEVNDRARPLSEKVERINLYYFPFLKDNYDNYPKRMRDLDSLADLTVTYRSLNRFLNDMALEPPDEDGSGVETKGESLVLSTIHSSKGLEWHTVIVIWAAEGRIPSPMALDSPDDLEEERRMVYVAATRAQRNLVIVAPQIFEDRRKGRVYVELSRFFRDVPQECFRTLT